MVTLQVSRYCLSVLRSAADDKMLFVATASPLSSSGTAQVSLFSKQGQMGICLRERLWPPAAMARAQPREARPMLF